jgi:hypothetical protein
MKDLIAYVRECWNAALNLRERRRQVWALLGGIFALPIVWLMGGKLELTQQGVLWTAVWATTSALFTLFVIAPFHLWREQRAERSSEVGPDMTIRELFLHLDPNSADEPARSVIGQVVRDFFAIQGKLRVWGRPCDADWIDRLTDWPGQPVPQLINHRYWRNADFTYLFMNGISAFSQGPHTQVKLHSGLPQFTDLRVNRAQALAIDWSEVDRVRSAFDDAHNRQLQEVSSRVK